MAPDRVAGWINSRDGDGKPIVVAPAPSSTEIIRTDSAMAHPRGRKVRVALPPPVNHIYYDAY